MYSVKQYDSSEQIVEKADETVVAQFEAQSRNFPRRADVNQEKIQISRSADGAMNWVPQEHK
jgi:hypothetical protein